MNLSRNFTLQELIKSDTAVRLDINNVCSEQCGQTPSTILAFLIMSANIALFLDKIDRLSYYWFIFSFAL